MGNGSDLTIARTPGRGRPIGLRVLGWSALGAFLLIVVSLPWLADESNPTPPAGYYAVVAVLFAAVASRIYVVLRRASISRLPAALVALVTVPGTYVLAGVIFLGIAIATS